MNRNIKTKSSAKTHNHLMSMQNFDESCSRSTVPDEWIIRSKDGRCVKFVCASSTSIENYGNCFDCSIQYIWCFCCCFSAATQFCFFNSFFSLALVLLYWLSVFIHCTQHKIKLHICIVHSTFVCNWYIVFVCLFRFLFFFLIPNYN